MSPPSLSEPGRGCRRQPAAQRLLVLLLAVATLPVLSRQYLGRTAGEIPIFMNAVDALWQGRLYSDAVFEYPPYALIWFLVPHAWAHDVQSFRLAFGLEIWLVDAAIKAMLLWRGIRRRQGFPDLVLFVYSLGSAALGHLLLMKYDAVPAALSLTAVLAVAGGWPLVGGRHGRARRWNEGLPRPVHPDPGDRRVAVERSPSPSIRGRRCGRGRAAAAAGRMDAVVEVRGLPRWPRPGSGIAGGECRLGAAPHRRGRILGAGWNVERGRRSARQPVAGPRPPVLDCLDTCLRHDGVVDDAADCAADGPLTWKRNGTGDSGCD